MSESSVVALLESQDRRVHAQSPGLTLAESALDVCQPISHCSILRQKCMHIRHPTTQCRSRSYTDSIKISSLRRGQCNKIFNSC